MNRDFQNFKDYVNDQKDKILDLHTSKDKRVYAYKVSLLYSLIDFMSKSVYNINDNKKRMTQFVSDFCNWNDKDRLSIPQLNEYILSNDSS